MKRWLLAAALLLALAGSADARMHHPARGHRILQGGAPLDTFTAPSGAYSFRKLKSTYAGPAIRIRRASDNLETDINFLGGTGFTGAPIDTAAAAAHCAATTCFIRTWYDQSGNARDLPQATAANQPALIFGCTVTGLPCARSSINTQQLALVVPVSTTGSYSAVAKRSVGLGTGFPLMLFGTFTTGITLTTTAGVWTLSRSTGGSINGSGSETAWHAAVGTINGAASVFNIDGTEVTGTITGAVDNAQLTLPIGGDVPGTLDETEAVHWQGYALTGPERTALTNNQRAFWGF